MYFLFLCSFITSIVTYLSSLSNLYNTSPSFNNDILFRKKCLDLLYKQGQGMTVESSELQDQVIEFNQRKLNQIKIGCTTYKSGQMNASIQEYVLEPLLVDLQNDIMCFMLSNAIKNVDSNIFQFLINLPDVYKVSPSLYHIIENFENYVDTIDEFDLVISYLPSIINSSSIFTSDNIKGDEEAIADVNSKSWIEDILEQLSLQSISSISSSSSVMNNSIDTSGYFWTFASTPSLLRRRLSEKMSLVTSSSLRTTNINVVSPTDNTYQQDMKRMEAWHKMANSLRLHDNNNNRDAINENDPCAFKSILFTDAENRIIISMQKWSDLIQNEENYVSCMVLAISAFAHSGSVYHISALIKPKPSTFRSRSIQQSGIAGAISTSNPYTNAGLTGRNQIVSIADTGVDVNSCFFSDTNHANSIPVSLISAPTHDLSYRKVVQYIKNTCGDDSDAVDGHGTHVASILAGSIDGDLFYSGISEYSGIAPGAKIAVLDLGISYSLCIPALFSDLIAGPYLIGTRVFSYSWDSLFPNNSPDYQGRYIDKYLYNHPEVLILFAAGNAGQQGSGSISVQSTAKNIVSVGAGEIETPGSAIGRVAYFSSQGPTYDGRIKPDIIAPGDGLQSAYSNGNQGSTCKTTAMTGTSSATPSAAGIALMIRQYFEENSNRFWLAKCNKGYVKCRSSFSPSGVLIKAILLHSGRALQEYTNSATQQHQSLSSPPDFIQGYGRILLKSVLPLPGIYTKFDLYVDDLKTIQENSLIIYKVQVQYSNSPLKITLVWYDPPAVTGTTQKALIHDLDLTVFSPSNRNMYGNGGNSPDSLNTNEQVYVAKAEAGIWVVRVSTNALVNKSQRYSIVITSKGYVLQP